MKFFPVLNIGQFPDEAVKDFYASDFVHHIKLHHQTIAKPHKHDFYLSVLFTQGTGTHEVDFNSYQIKKGSVFMLNPGQTHHWEVSSDTNGYVIFHTREFYDLFFSNNAVDSFPFFYSLQASPCLYLETGQLACVTKLFQDILEEYHADALLKGQKIHSLLNILYIELSRAYIKNDQEILNRTPGMYLARTRMLEQMIDENYLTEKSARAYAEMMHMSTRHLNRITQSVLGKSVTDLITGRVLLEAQRMLTQPSASIAEVAGYLGYDDHAYFSRLFKKKLGVPPSVFARKYE